MTQLPIGILGSTGHLGTRVAKLLGKAGAPHVLFARDPASPHVPRQDSTIDVRRADYADAASLRAAFDGIGTLLMVSAVESPERLAWHGAIIDAAGATGVQHIVYASFMGAAPDATFTFARDHFATEQLLEAAAKAGGPSFTALRDNFYLDVLIEFVGPDGVLRGPAGEGRVSAVARDDVAAVAAVVVQDPGTYAGQRLDVTGREALSMSDVAALIEDHTGRPTRFVDESDEEAYASRAHYGAPQWQVDAWVSTYTAIRSGELAEISDTVERLTGRRAKTLADLLRR